MIFSWALKRGAGHFLRYKKWGKRLFLDLEKWRPGLFLRIDKWEQHLYLTLQKRGTYSPFHKSREIQNDVIFYKKIPAEM